MDVTSQFLNLSAAELQELRQLSHGATCLLFYLPCIAAGYSRPIRSRGLISCVLVI